MKNIIITSAGKRVALTRCFSETLSVLYPNAKVFTTDMNPKMAPAGYVSDKCFKVPRVTDAAYTLKLLEICIENEVEMIVPTIDTELLILATNREMFDKNGIDVIVSDLPFVTMCRDKRNTGDFFIKHHIRIPKPIDKNHPEFPLFAKPYDGSLSTDLHYIKTADELTAEIIDNPKLLFMEYIDKSRYKEYTVDMYYGRDNRLKELVPRERIEIRAGEINKGRTSKNYIVGFLKERLDFIRGCVGCICLQLFYNEKDHDIVGIEINPRFGGGYPQSYAAGANYPKFLIEEYFLDKELTYTDDWKDNLIMLRYDDAIFV